MSEDTNDYFETKREKMWETTLSLSEEYTSELLNDETVDDETLSQNLSTGFDVLAGVLSEWVAAINRDVMELNREEHIAFVKELLEVVEADMIESYDELDHEDDLETLYNRAHKIVNPDQKED